MIDYFSPQVISGLLSGFLSGFLTAGVAISGIFLSFKMRQKHEQVVFRRGKLEEVGLLFVEWFEIARIRIIRYELMVKGEIERAEALKNENENGMSELEYLQKIKVIVLLHLPSLMESYSEVLAAYGNIPSDSFESNTSVGAEEFSKYSKNLHTASTNFTIKLGEYSESLAISD